MAGFNATTYLDPNTWNSIIGASGGDSQSVNSSIQQFMNAFKTLTGQDPTTQQIQDYANQALMSAEQAPGQLSYNDAQNLANNYIQNTFGPQVAANAQTQQTNQLGKTTGLINDLVSNVTGNVAKDFANPNSSAYQAFSGNLNNMGISPSSGAFQAGLGSTLGNAATGAINNALQTVGIPAIGNIQGLSNFPLQTAQNNSNLTNLGNLMDFGLQESYNQKLFDESQPSGLTTALGQAGMATKAFSDLGGFLPVGSGAGPTSYVCWALIDRGLLCEQDLDEFHVHIMPALFKKARAFWKYAMYGKKLVDAVNERGLNWKHFKPLLFDRVMEEPDPCKAVDLYADACHQLCASSDPSIWDQRVMRTSFWDSLAFIPLLLCYPPFLRALWKCLRIKMLIVYDRPRCSHGS